MTTARTIARWLTDWPMPGSVVIVGVVTMALSGCSTAPPSPAPEAAICARVEDNVRVEDSYCTGAWADVVDSPAGQVRILQAADQACLETDDYTPVGMVANDDYLGDGCDDDSHAKAKKTTTAKPTKKSTPTTTKKKPA